MNRLRTAIPSLLFFFLVFAACSDDSGTAANQPYDETEIRTKVYISLYNTLQLDTIGYHAIAIAQGDSLRSGFFWPQKFTRHAETVFESLSGALPLRIVGMDEINPPGESVSNVPYLTIDTGEPVIPAFTRTIERMDGTHIVVVCGVYCPLKMSGYAACNLTYESGEWKVRSLEFYYLWGWI